jgi:predicted PurR-regulated permease PerM
MVRIASFAVLVAILLAIAVLFYKVMANFLLPLFLAVLLVVIFQPLHNWCIKKCGGRGRLAAGLTTAGIVLIVLVPLLAILLQAGAEGVAIYDKIQRMPRQQAQTDKPQGEDATLADAVVDIAALANEIVGLGERVGLNLAAGDVEKNIRQGIQDWLGPVALSSARFTGNLLIGIAVMIVSLYYFLADGPWMIRKVMQLSPLDDRYEEQLIDQFTQISRAVVLATLLSALTQGLLAGIGFYFAGVSAVFLLTVLAMLFAMVPFVGTTIIWVPTCLWLYFVDDRPVAAIALAVYCGAIVATADNVIKPLVLHGRSNLHPLLALLSVIGGVQALGPIGIFVGPMVVVFLHALLNMFHGELEAMGATTTQKAPDGGPSPKARPADS